jgi:hypothetical protein
MSTNGMIQTLDDLRALLAPSALAEAGPFRIERAATAVIDARTGGRTRLELHWSRDKVAGVSIAPRGGRPVHAYPLRFPFSAAHLFETVDGYAAAVRG